MAKQKDPLKQLGDALRARRLDLEMSQYELARRCKMHRTFIAGVERGERNVSVLTLRRIIEQLEMTIAEAFSQAEL